MNKQEETTRTHKLLNQLDRAIDRSSVIRDIVEGYQRLHSLERITGPSLQTRSLRREIADMEDRLRFES